MPKTRKTRGRLPTLRPTGRVTRSQFTTQPPPASSTTSHDNSTILPTVSTVGLIALIQAEFHWLSQSQSVTGTASVPSSSTVSSQPIMFVPLPRTEVLTTIPSNSGFVCSLGHLPPPSSLVSLPILTNPSVSSVSLHSAFSFNAPVGTTQAHPLPILGMKSHPSLPGIPSSQPRVSLLPAADPIPHNLVQRIQSGQFVEMRDLLADNIALLHQLSSLQGMVPLPQSVVSRIRLREIPSLVSWLYCFNAYVAVCTTDSITRGMLAYSRLLIREALRHGATGWLEYDRVFRRHLAINPSLSWNTIEPGLQAATIFGRGPTAGVFCSLCNECDHTLSQCALAPVQQQVVATAPSQQPVSSPRPHDNSRSARRPETLLHICVNWNKGSCKRSFCSFRHICATCHLNHRARDCPDTSPDSEYKTVTGQPSRLPKKA